MKQGTGRSDWWEERSVPGKSALSKICSYFIDKISKYRFRQQAQPTLQDRTAPEEVGCPRVWGFGVFFSGSSPKITFWCYSWVSKGWQDNGGPKAKAWSWFCKISQMKLPAGLAATTWGWARRFVLLSSAFLWGEEDANVLIRALERDREKHMRGRTQVSSSSAILVGCCAPQHPAHGRADRATLEALSADVLQWRSYSSLAWRDLASGRRSAPSVGCVDGIHTVPHSWSKTTKQHLCKVTPMK